MSDEKQPITKLMDDMELWAKNIMLFFLGVIVLIVITATCPIWLPIRMYLKRKKKAK